MVGICLASHHPRQALQARDTALIGEGSPTARFARTKILWAATPVTSHAVSTVARVVGRGVKQAGSKGRAADWCRGGSVTLAGVCVLQETSCGRIEVAWWSLFLLVLRHIESFVCSPSPFFQQACQTIPTTSGGQDAVPGFCLNRCLWGAPQHP